MINTAQFTVCRFQLMLESLKLTGSNIFLHFWLSGYGLVEASYRAQGVLTEFLLFGIATALIEGYHGSTARTGVVSTGAYLSSKRIGYNFTGCIPDSLRIEGNEWTDDVILHCNYYRAQPGLRSIFWV